MALRSGSGTSVNLTMLVAETRSYRGIDFQEKMVDKRHGDNSIR
jgi:hypothetical protein